MNEQRRTRRFERRQMKREIWAKANFAKASFREAYSLCRHGIRILSSPRAELEYDIDFVYAERYLTFQDGTYNYACGYAAHFSRRSKWGYGGALHRLFCRIERLAKLQKCKRGDYRPPTKEALKCYRVLVTFLGRIAYFSNPSDGSVDEAYEALQHFPFEVRDEAIDIYMDRCWYEAHGRHCLYLYRVMVWEKDGYDLSGQFADDNE